MISTHIQWPFSFCDQGQPAAHELQLVWRSPGTVASSARRVREDCGKVVAAARAAASPRSGTAAAQAGAIEQA